MKIKFEKVRCPICDTYENSRVLYKKNFSPKDLNVNIFSARRIPDRIHYQIVKCNTCGLVRSDPVASGKVLDLLYRNSKFTYNNEVDNLKLTYIEALQSCLKKMSAEANILEIGCGNGFVIEELQKMGFNNVYGIEPSLDAKDNAIVRVKSRITTGMFDKNSFDNNKFDLIFTFQTLDHIPDPNTFIKNVTSKLKKNGFFLAFNHDVSSYSSKIFGEKSPIIDIEHTFLYDRKTIIKLFEKFGIIIEKVYSPANIISLKHLIHLLPLPLKIKNRFTKSNSILMNLRFKAKLGNLCIIGQKGELK